MTSDDIRAFSALPPANSSYPEQLYRFTDREYLVITYHSYSDAIRAMVPEPLTPDGSGQVHYEWLNMPHSSGIGSYQESGVVIACLFHDYTA